MKKVCTGAQMRETDRYAINDLRIPGLLLMEAAARSVAEEILKRAAEADRILVLCGGGNNGGDGFAIARFLKQQGMNVKVFSLEEPSTLKGDARTQYEMLAAYKIPLIRPDQVYVIENMIMQADWVVDAIFGIGLSRNIDGIVRQLVLRINEAREKNGLKVAAVDVPTGIHADNGRVMGCAIRADITVTFSQLKAGLMLYPGHDYAGEVIVRPIGIPQGAHPVERVRWFTIEKSDVPGLLPKRYNRSHKGSYGRLMVAAGSKNMTGASVLSASAAYKMGTGLVDMIIPKDIRPVVQSLLPEVIITPYEVIKESVDHGSMVDPRDTGTVREAIAISSAVLMGPGWSQVPYVVELMGLILDALPEETPAVLDADALNILATRAEIKEKVIAHGGQTVLTPHMGEASRLLKRSVAEIAEDPVSAALDLAKEYNAVCVLKDALTLVASPDGRIYFNTTGNHGMATAGSGDVLAGMIGGLTAEGLEPFEAAYLGVYLHGAAGDRAAAALGHYGMMASDICAAIDVETLAGIRI